MDITLFTTICLFFLLGIFFIIIGIFGWLLRFKLSRYLKMHKYKRWEYLTSFGLLGPGIINGFRSISYIYSNQDNEDIKIKNMKIKIRKTNLYGLIVIVFFIIVWNIISQLIAT